MSSNQQKLSTSTTNSAVSPETVSEIVRSVEAAGRAGRLDLREFQRRLLKLQRANRDPRPAREAARAAQLKHRFRVREPRLADCSIIDTGADQPRQQLYFELSNGQIVSAKRILGLRRGHPRNSVLFKKVEAAVEAQASRTERRAA